MRIWCIPTSTRLDVTPSPLLPPRTDRDIFFRSPPPPPRLSRQEKLDRGVIVLKPKKVRHKRPDNGVKTKLVKPVRQARRVRYADQEQYWVTPENREHTKPPTPFEEIVKVETKHEDKEDEEEDVFCDICCFQDRCTHEEVWRQREEDRLSTLEDRRQCEEDRRRSSLDQRDSLDRPPSRGTEVLHSRQQSNTSGTSSLTSPSSHNYQSQGDQENDYGHHDYRQNDPGYSSSSGRGSSGKYN